jgi:hypothetical protein
MTRRSTSRCVSSGVTGVVGGQLLLNHLKRARNVVPAEGPPHCEPRFEASELHRAMTSLYCALALVTASTSLAVGATSASCIAIAAAIIAARTLSKVGGPLGV